MTTNRTPIAAWRTPRAAVLLVALLFLAASRVSTQSTPSTLPAGFVDEPVAGGLDLPVAFTELPDGRFLVAQKTGIVQLIRNGVVAATPFIDLRTRVNDYWDRGLLGIAADMNFSSNGYVYLYYVFENNAADYAGPKTSRLTRVTAVGDTAQPATEVTLLGSVSGAGCSVTTADCIPANSPSHNGGGLRIGADGTLYLTTGDGASFSVVDELALRAQDPDSLAGKLLHVTPDGRGIATNRWWNGRATANRSKVMALGLRNPLRLGLRPGTDVPYIGDVGWSGWEEINVGAGNFGWPCYEGVPRQDGYSGFAGCQSLYAQGAAAVVPPTYAYPHQGGSMAVVGGAFYTGATYPSAYQGAYFFADYVLGEIRYLHVDSNDALISGPSAFATGLAAPVDIQMGRDGNLYYVAIGSGAAGSGALRRIRFDGGSQPIEYASDRSWSSATNGWGPAERDRSNGEAGAADGGTLTINGRTYPKGIGVHAPSDIRIELGAACTTFASDVGVDDEVGSNGSVVFQVWADGVKLYDSGVMTGPMPASPVRLDIAGRQQLALIVTDGGDGVNYDHADWGGVTLECAGSTSLFAPATSVPAGTNTHSVAFAAVDGDAVLDLVAANTGSSTVSVWRGTGDGTFGARADFATGQAPKHVAIRDLNNDARVDLVTANQDADTVSILLANGSGGFAPRVDYPACAGPHETALADFNADGITDVMVACWGGSVVSVLAGRPGGTFGAAVNYAAGLNPHSVVAGDFTADGLMDVAVANRGGNTVSVLAGRGNGGFAGPVDYPVGAGPHSIRSGDLDGDGRPDLVTANDGSNGVSVLRSRGDGTFAAAVDYAAGRTPKGVALADVNGDGRLDVLTANTAGSYPVCCQPGGDTISLLLGTGTGALGSASAVRVGQTPFAVTAGDIDRDGDLDVATANWHSNDVSILLNRSTVSNPRAPSGATYLSDLPWLSMTNGWGPVERDQSNGEANAGDGGLITLQGTVYAKGLGVHPSSELRYAVPSGCTQLLATVGVDDEVGTNGSMTFSVRADGVLLFESSRLLGSSPGQAVAVDVTGRTEVQLTAQDGGDGVAYDHGDWAAARFVCGSSTGNTPPAVTITSPDPSVRFSVGDVISFAATVTDAEDGALPASSVTWEATLDHCVGGACHPHPFSSGTGSSGSFVAPDHLDEYSFRIVFTGVDSGGLRGSGTATVLPRMVDVTLDTVPSGLQVVYGGTGATAPVTVPTVAGATRSIFAASPQGQWTFASWSDGGLQQHEVRIGSTAARYVATFQGGSTQSTFVSDRSWSLETNGWGPAERDRSNGEAGAADGGPLRLNGQTYAKGIGVHPPSDIRIALGGACSTFTTALGVDDEVGNAGSVTFQVWADGVLLYDSGVMTGATPTVNQSVAIAGRQQLALVVLGGDSIAYDHADWAAATLECGSAPPAPATRYLSDAPATSMVNGWGPVELDASNGEALAGDGRAITVNGTAYAKGLGVHARSQVTYAVPSGCTQFLATVGVDDEVGDRGSMTFTVRADGIVLFRSATLLGSGPGQAIAVDVSGRTSVELTAEDAGDGIAYDHGDWAAARFQCGGA